MFFNHWRTKKFCEGKKNEESLFLKICLFFSTWKLKINQLFKQTCVKNTNYIYIYILVGTHDLQTLRSPLVSLNLVHVLVFFRNFYPARLQEFFLLLLFHHLLLPGWGTWMMGRMMGWMNGKDDHHRTD